MRKLRLGGAFFCRLRNRGFTADGTIFVILIPGMIGVGSGSVLAVFTLSDNAVLGIADAGVAADILHVMEWVRMCISGMIGVVAAAIAHTIFAVVMSKGIAGVDPVIPAAVAALVVFIGIGFAGCFCYEVQVIVVTQSRSAGIFFKVITAADRAFVIIDTIV